MGTRRRARILAFQSLYRYDVTQESLKNLLDFGWSDIKQKENEKAEIFSFATLIISGTIENLDTIDKKIEEHLENWDFERLAKVDLANLRISVYGILFQSDVPPSVIIDEAIDIAKEFGTDNSYKFINGVLDSIYKSLNEKI